MLQSTRNGGLGLGVRDHLDVISTLARGCASTAWVAGVVHAHSWLLSHFPAQGQDDVYGDDPDAVVAAVILPRGRAVKTTDGYRLEGVWAFASGSERASWLLLGAVVVDGATATWSIEGVFIVPTSDVTYLDDWYVTGLRATGSCTVKLDGLDIPNHRFLSMRDLIMGNSPGGHLHTDWVQRCAPVPVLTIALTGGALGLARQALEDFPPLVRGKTIAYTADRQDTHPITHVKAGGCGDTGRGSASCCSIAAPTRSTPPAQAGTELPLLTRARMRVDCAVGVRRCLEAVEILFTASGGTGVRSSSPLAGAGRSEGDQQPRPAATRDEPGDVRAAADGPRAQHPVDLNARASHGPTVWAAVLRRPPPQQTATRQRVGGQSTSNCTDALSASSGVTIPFTISIWRGESR